MAVNAGRKLGPRVYRTYTNDALQVGRVKIDKDFADASELGFSADNPALGPLPSRSKMRHVFATSGSGSSLIRKKLPCGNLGASAYTTSGTTVSIDGVSFTTYGHIGEKFPITVT